MNNQIPYFMNNQNPNTNHINNPNYMINNNFHLELEKIMNKLNRLEKNLRILENRINKLEMDNDNKFFKDDPTDMYMV